VHFGAKLAHLLALVFGWECDDVAVVEGFDFLGDPEVLLGDGSVGDAGVDHRHLEDLCLICG
jgi:hypothetical protein